MSAPTSSESKGLRQVTDTGAIEAKITEIMAANANKVAEYRTGKEKLFGFFGGQVMSAMAARPTRRCSTPCRRRSCRGDA
jgi:aspartyl-tRNA(Asn)/glutamyl-tRNA(Gln) amidotransferase subunit B